MLESSNINSFLPYRWNGTNWVSSSNSQNINTINTINGKAGDLVIRFDQIKSGSDKLALIVDNNLYINPLSSNVQDLTWFDKIFANALVNWASNNTSNNNSISLVYFKVKKKNRFKKTGLL